MKLNVGKQTPRGKVKSKIKGMESLTQNEVTKITALTKKGTNETILTPRIVSFVP